MMNHDSCQIQVDSTWYAFSCHDCCNAASGGAYKFLMRTYNTDVLDALPDDNVDRRNTDVPLPRSLCLTPRSVWHSSLASFSALTTIGITVV